MILKNRVLNLKNYLISEDISKKGVVNYERFERVISKLGIPDSVMNKDDIKYLF